MIRSLRSLIAPAFAVLALGLATSAQANYDVTTAITGATGGTLSAGNTVLTVGTAVLTFGNYSSLNNASNAMVFPTESVTASGSYTGAPVAVSVVETITLTNPTGSTTSTSITQTVNYTLTTGGFIFQSTFFDGMAASATLTAGGQSFALTNANATNVQFGQVMNNGAISAVITPNAVPEPASFVMLGLGLVGTVGFAARRRLA